MCGARPRYAIEDVFEIVLADHRRRGSYTTGQQRAANWQPQDPAVSSVDETAATWSILAHSPYMSQVRGERQNRAVLESRREPISE